MPATGAMDRSAHHVRSAIYKLRHLELHAMVNTRMTPWLALAMVDITETGFSATFAAPAIMEWRALVVSVKPVTQAQRFLDLLVFLEVLQILLFAPAIMGTAEMAFPVCRAMLDITVAAGYASNADNATSTGKF